LIILDRYDALTLNRTSNDYYRDSFIVYSAREALRRLSALGLIDDKKDITFKGLWSLFNWKNTNPEEDLEIWSIK
jgi:hypothetical protein